MHKPLRLSVVLSLIIWCARFQPAAAQFIDYTLESGISIASEIANWGCGMSAFDFNGDGFDDLTIGENMNGIALYESLGDGNFQSVGFIPLVATIKQVMWVDFDNDDDADLFATTLGSGFYLFERMNNDEFELRDDLFNLFNEFDAQGACWGDYDNDGWLDLFICYYLIGQEPERPNALFHNEQGTFVEVGEQMGVASWANQAFQGVWTDFDRDGWKDLYVINDHEVGNEYYRNVEGQGFENLSGLNGSGVHLTSMSNSLADYDRDGDFDIFISNGGQQVLLRNTDEWFENVASGLSLDVFTFAWSALWIDQNNDGWQDLYLCNTNGYNNGDNNFFWINDEGEEFEESEFESYELSSFVAVTGDFNNDRFADMAVYNGYPSSVHVWLNNAQSGHHSVKLNLRGEVSDYFGVGAEVRAFIGDNISLQQVLAGENYLAQNSSSVIVGCDDAQFIDSLIVTWPSGWSDRFFNVPVDSNYTIEEGATFQPSVNSSSDFGMCEGSVCMVDLTMNDSNFLGSIVWGNGQEGYHAQLGDTGLHAVTVTNQFGLQRTINFNIHHFALPDIETIVTAPICYAQSNGSCTVLSSDVAMIDGNAFQSSFMLEQLASGDYTYSIMDVNGCNAALSFTIPETPAMSLLQDAYTVCADAVALSQLAIEGAVLPIDVMFETGSSLDEGEQFIVITDQNECTASFSIFIEHFPEAQVDVQSDTACFGGVAAWSFDVAGDVQIVSVEVLNASQEELPAGDYVLQSMDEFGCAGLHTFSVHEYDSIQIEFSMDEETNQLSSEVIGGVAPYSLQWSTGENTSGIAVDEGGVYSLNIEDAAACTASADTTIVISNVVEFDMPHSFYITPLCRFISLENAAAGQFMVFDAQGRVVHRARVLPGKQQLNTTGWSCGRYVWVLLR